MTTKEKPSTDKAEGISGEIAQGKGSSVCEGTQESAIKYSRGKKSTDNLPDQREAADFKAFAEAVLADRSAEKGMTYICAPLAVGLNRDPEKYPGEKTWRAAHLAQPRRFLPLDFDGADSPESAMRALEFLRARYQGFAYTTSSHTPEAPRWRGVLAQTRATSREEGMALGEAVQALVEAAVGEGKVKFDASVYRAEQPFFAPMHVSNDCYFDGQPVDVDKLLASAPPRKPKGKSPAGAAKIEDKILRTLNELGMVLGDQGHGKFNIECPFASEHSSATGASSTVYYQAHTGGFAEAHIKCMHSHCSNRTNSEFMVALLARYTKEKGRHADWGVAPPKATNPVERTIDHELEWILANAPPPMKAYIKWFMENAFRSHLVFAIFSALLFFQSFAGRNVRLPRDLRCNLWMLLFAPTESGKGATSSLVSDALKQLADKKAFAAVQHFANRFGSLEGMLWRLSKFPQVIWVNEEMVKTLLSLMAAKEGTSQYNMNSVLMELHDAATKPYMDPIHYTGRDKRANEMEPLVHPFFSAIGMGVPQAIGKFNDAAVDDGGLNRFLPFVVEGLPPIGTCQPVTTLPAELVNWATGLQVNGVVEFFDQDNPMPKREPRILEIYPEFEDDWKRENEYGALLAQNLPGVWGRYAEKILQVAMLYACADSVKLTRDGFDWAKRLVHWTVSGFAQRFEAEGGGAVDNMDKVRKAFLAFFKKDIAVEFYEKAGYLSSGFIAQNCSAWKRNIKERPAVVNALVDEGVIEEVEIASGGKGYRLLAG
ncbi:hypothetical protein D3C78_513650 [compost metagenome]